MVDQHTQEAEENDEQTQAAKTTQKEPNEEQEINRNAGVGKTNDTIEKH